MKIRKLWILVVLVLIAAFAGGGSASANTTPDLLPVGTCKFTATTAGGIGTLNISVLNIGTSDAPPSTTGFEFFILDSTTPPFFFSRGAFVIGTDAIPGADPAHAVPAPGVVHLPPIRVPPGCPRGNCYFEIVADVTNSIVEISEDNNIFPGRPGKAVCT